MGPRERKSRSAFATRRRRLQGLPFEWLPRSNQSRIRRRVGGILGGHSARRASEISPTVSTESATRDKTDASSRDSFPKSLARIWPVKSAASLASQGFTVLSAPFALLFVLDDSVANLPVRGGHDGVHRSRRAPARFLQQIHDSLKQSVVRIGDQWRSVCHQRRPQAKWR